MTWWVQLVMYNYLKVLLKYTWWGSYLGVTNPFKYTSLVIKILTKYFLSAQVPLTTPVLELNVILTGICTTKAFNKKDG